MTRTYTIISCDGHLEIPPDGWMRHVPPEHRDRAPRLVKLAGGGEGWIVEGMPIIHNGQNVSAGRPLKTGNPGSADVLLVSVDPTVQAWQNSHVIDVIGE